jgi:uncharacterized protein YyaL (SSP411 family)
MKKNRDRPTYSHWDLLMASATEPIPKAKQRHHLLKMYEGLRSLEQAEAPTFHDWIACSDAVNMMETLTEMGVCSDASGLLNDAIKALAEAGERYKKHNVLRLTGEGIAALRAVLEDYAEVITSVPARTLMQCHVRTEARFRDLLAGRGRKDDIVVRPFNK